MRIPFAPMDAEAATALWTAVGVFVALGASLAAFGFSFRANRLAKAANDLAKAANDREDRRDQERKEREERESVVWSIEFDPEHPWRIGLRNVGTSSATDVRIDLEELARVALDGWSARKMLAWKLQPGSIEWLWLLRGSDISGLPDAIELSWEYGDHSPPQRTSRRVSIVDWKSSHRDHLRGERDRERELERAELERAELERAEPERAEPERAESRQQRARRESAPRLPDDESN